MDEEPEEKPKSALQKQIEKAIARVTSPCDQNLVNLKEVYDTMTDDEKKVLKTWIEQVIPLARSPATALRGRLLVELKYPIGSEEEIHVSGVTALAIKNAIEHWERGDHYTPNSMQELWD